MSWWQWILLGVGLVAIVVAIVALRARTRRDVLVQLVKLIPACLKLIRDVLRDPTIARRRKIAPVLAIVYLSLPIDLIPDFIPVLGQLDDALVIAWTLRHIVRSAGRDRVEALWSADADSLQLVLRLARIA